MEKQKGAEDTSSIDRSFRFAARQGRELVERCDGSVDTGTAWLALYTYNAAIVSLPSTSLARRFVAVGASGEAVRVQNSAAGLPLVDGQARQGCVPARCGLAPAQR